MAKFRNHVTWPLMSSVFEITNYIGTQLSEMCSFFKQRYWGFICLIFYVYATVFLRKGSYAPVSWNLLKYVVSQNQILLKIFELPGYYTKYRYLDKLIILFKKEIPRTIVFSLQIYKHFETFPYMQTMRFCSKSRLTIHLMQVSAVSEARLIVSGKSRMLSKTDVLDCPASCR